MMSLYISYASLGLALLLIVLSSLLGDFKFRRLLLTSMFVVTLSAGYVVLTDLLSRPKPIEMFWNAPKSERAYVLGFWWEENVGIYLFLLVPEFDEPRYYKFPWSINMAEKLQAADKEARELGQQGFIMDFPFEDSFSEGDNPIYAEPHPMPPPKATPDDINVIEIPR